MGRAPCCDKTKVKRGPWSPEEDTTLKNYVQRHGTGGNWIALPHKAGLKRCGKSCRLRWLNYLRPDIKHGGFTEEEDNIILTLYSNIGSRWSVIASHLQGRTDNDVKNYWNTKLKKLFAKKSTRDNNVSNVAVCDVVNSNNSIHFTSPIYVPKPETSGYGNSSNINSSMVTYYDPVNINLVPEMMGSHPIQFPVPSLVNVPDFGASGNDSYNAASLMSRQVSSLEASFCFENGGAAWSGDGGGEFLMDMGSGFPCDILSCPIDFEGKIGEF